MIINPYRFGVSTPPPGGISLLGTSTGQTAYGAIGTFTIPYPTSLSTGDTVILTVFTEFTDTAPTIAGFTQIASADLGTINSFHVFKGNGFSGAGSWTVNYTATGDSFRSGSCSVWSGADAANIVVGPVTNTGAGSPGTATWSSVTSTSAGLLLALFSRAYGGTTDVPTSLSPAHTLAGVTHNSMQHWYLDDPTVGASGSGLGTDTGLDNVLDRLSCDPGGVEMSSIVKSSGWTTATVTPASGFYQVSGTQILDPAGDVFYPFGVNTGIHHTNFPYPFRFTDVPQTGAINSLEGDTITWPSHVDDAKTWGFNYLRVNVVGFNDDPSFNPGGDPITTGAGMVETIRHGVDELLDAGFVVLMDGRTNQPGDNTATLGSTNDLNARSYVGRCLELWGDNPNFWINPFNEPFDGDSPAQITSMITLYTDWITFLRGEGYQNPIVFDLPRYAQGIDKVTDGSFDAFMALDDNLILSWHNYGFVTSFAPANKATIESAAVAAHAKGYCILIGEVGYQWDGGSPIPVAGAYNANLWASQWAFDDGTAQNLDMGVCAWHAGHDEFNFTSDRQPFFNSPNDGTGLNSFGEMVWSRGQTLDLAGHIVVP